MQKQKEAVGGHFCFKNHSTSDLQVQIIEYTLSKIGEREDVD